MEEENLGEKITTTIRLNKSTDQLLDDFAKERGSTRSEIIESAIRILFKVAKEDSDSVGVELDLSSCLAEQKKLLLEIHSAVHREQNLLHERRTALAQSQARRDAALEQEKQR
ncbi:MAG: CopG family transcriptional regulator [Candidatus Diapherotrites archaeon]